MDESIHPNRRRFLAAAGMALAAGCAAPTGDGPGTDTPGSSPGSTGTPPDDGPSHDVEDWEGYDPDWEAPSSSPTEGSVSTEVLVENLEVPWDISVAPTGELFITERVGRILKFESGDVVEVLQPRDAIDAGSIPPDASEDEKGWWVEGGEGGLLGVAVHPSYPDPAYVYAYYTTEAGGDTHNRVSRFDASADDPAASEEVLVDAIPGGSYHDGGRIGFGPRNYLWVTTGDAGEDALAANPGSLGGKVLRITADGDPAPGNPDLGPDADRRVFSYGHRNPQGITWLPDATPVSTEHGPSARDEINVLEAGGNFGWPDARTESAYRQHPDVRRPVVNTGTTTWAPTGCVFYTGEAIPQWRNRLVIGTLRGQHVNVVTLTPEGGDLPPADGGAQRFDASWLDDSYTATSHRFFEDDLGRVRLVTQGPDGHLYAITSNRDGRPEDPFPTGRDDVLVRLTAE